MNPRMTLKKAIKSALALSLLFVFPSVAPAQTEPKKNPPPPPPKKTAPPPTQQRPAQPTPGQTNARPAGTTGAAKPATTVPGRPNTGQPPQTGPNKTSTTGPGKPNTVPGNRNASTIPSKTTTSGPSTINNNGGGKTVTTPSGHTLEYNKTGHLDRVVTSHGAEAHFDARGGVRTIHTANGTTIFHGPGGQRQIVTEHRDVRGRVDGRVVALGPHRGFAERRFERGGHEYMRRTYVYGGRTYVSVYRGYGYRGVVYYRYVPAYYYGPAYYAWGYNRWGAPIVYTGWGWAGSPWYGAYGYYFAPYPVYPSAAFWLTDYLIAQNLQAAYEAQANANAAAVAANSGPESAPPQQTASTQVALSPEVKQMIAEEVKAQLAAEQAAAGQSAAPAAATAADSQPGVTSTDQVPPALDPNLRIFVVTSALDVNVNGEGCALSPGDVLMRTENTPDQDNTVAVSVVSSQKSDCAGGSAPRVQVADLEDMHNHFLEQMDAGLKTLADNQGKNGIPTGPAGTTRANPDGTAAPDLTAAADLQKQQQDANQAEKDVEQAAAPSGGGNNQ